MLLKARYRILGIIFVTFLSVNSMAQEPETSYQFWTSFIGDYVFKNGMLMDTEVAYNQLISGDEDWYEIAVTPILEMYPLNWLDLLAGSAFSYVHQFSDSSTFEIRPTLGARFLITPNRRFYLRNLLRLEYRYFFYLYNEENSGSGRIRNRIELIASITKPRYAESKNLYALADIEFFGNLGDAPQERYLYQFRWRIGMGYRFNNKWRTQLVYINQNSRDNFIRDGVDNHDNIWRIYLYWFINPITKN